MTDLLDLVGDEGIVLQVEGDYADILWRDGERSYLTRSNGRWRFPDCGGGYQAQYAYACGYCD